MNPIIFSFILICSTLFPTKTTLITGLNTLVVVDLKILNEKSSNINCPSGYIQATGCNDKCDLNYRVGGNYIYLCQKKIKFKDLSLNEQPVSKIKINYNNQNCGNLKLIDSDLNKGAGGEYIYLCYGADEEDPSPITDVFIYIPGLNEIPVGYECDWNNLNQGSKKKQKIYACFKKDKKVPHLIGYSNIVFDDKNKTISEIDLNDDIIYIDNDNYRGDKNQTIKRKIFKKIKSTYSFNFEESLSFIPRLESNIPLTFGLSESILFKAEFNYNESLGNIHIQSENEEVGYSCVAPAGKHIMCKAFSSDYKIIIPYKVDINYYYHDGTTEKEEFQSILTGVMGSSIQFSACCIKGCQNNDNICSSEEINNNDLISNTFPVEYNNDNDDNTQNNNNYLVVSDLVILSSKTKYINCPFGYEIINSRCDKEGCDLNYFAGGNYIYLCQKKQNIKFLKNEENIVNKIQVIGGDQKCDDKLKIINTNLNEDAGGDELFLCYGNNEDLSLNPISDFFIYIEGLNQPPQNYICSSIDLNEGTTKGKPTYLCYKRSSDFDLSLLKSENNQTLNESLNLGESLTIVSDLYVVNDKKQIISCPSGYDIVNSGCESTGCDLNSKAGGDYIYLCQKKEQLNKLSIKQNPINEVKILYNKDNNKNLKLIDVDLNKGAGGEYIYITYGYDSEKPLSPIVDFFVHIANINTPPEGYECDNNDLNKGTKKSGNKIYLCYKRNNKLPKEIFVNNIELFYNDATKINIGLPEKLDEIIVNSASITKTIEKTIIEERNLEKSFESYISLNVSASFLSLLELGYSLDYKFSNEEEWKYLTSKNMSTQIECLAESRKKKMCLPYFTRYQMNVPYKASLTYFNYKNEKIKETYSYGMFEKISASQISYKVCCLEGCCTGKKLLDADKPQCSKNKADVLCDEFKHFFN